MTGNLNDREENMDRRRVGAFLETCGRIQKLVDELSESLVYRCFPELSTEELVQLVDKLFDDCALSRWSCLKKDIISSIRERKSKTPIAL